MSIRSLLEINHDLCFKIEADPVGFVEHLRYYLGNGAQSSADELERWGVVVFGSRHHSAPFGPETVAKLCRREGEPERSARRNVDAAAVAYVRDCLAIFGQTMSDDQVFDLARKVRRAIGKAQREADPTPARAAEDSDL